MATDITQDKSKSVLFPVLGLSMDQLGGDALTLFFNLVVLAHGVPVPVDMLTNLWQQKVGCRHGAIGQGVVFEVAVATLASVVARR